MKIELGNNLEVLKNYPDNYFGSIVTDPPYGLSSGKNSKGGFMGKKWDASVPSVDLWKECLRVLKPGGHLLAFAGTRTQHRMACNIEDAGFEIRDMISFLYSTNDTFKELADSLNEEQFKLLVKTFGNENICGYMYGSGFPKSLNVGKAIDKLQGNERKEILRNPNIDGYLRKKGKPSGEFKKQYKDTINGCIIDSISNSEYEGFGTSLKPALEPITLARKPIEKGLSIAENVLKWGTGCINIDGCRIEYKVENEPRNRLEEESCKDDRIYKKGKNITYPYQDRSLKKSLENTYSKGRFPTNLIHDGSDEVLELFPYSKTGDIKPYKRKNENNINFVTSEYIGNHKGVSGSASRFFYCAKASTSERNKGLDSYEDKQRNNIYGEGLNSETKLVTDEQKEKGYAERKPAKNNHPTVKPQKLMEYLVKLITPPNQIVLDPFLGSGTTLIACKQLGFDAVGIELEEEYYNIAIGRINGKSR